LNQPKKIYFLLPGLTFGGAERVIFTLCNHLDRSKFKPTLVLFSQEGMPLDLLNSDVEVIDLKIDRIRYAIFKVISLIRKNKPDIVFGGWGEVSAFLSPIIPLFRNTKFVARETNVVSEHVKRKEIRFFYRFYNNFHRIIAQSDDMQKDLVENIHINPDKIVKINNPVDVEFIQKQMNSEKKFFDSAVKNVVAIGNLSERKGFDLLLNVFAHLKNESIHLSILGDGRDLAILWQQKEELGLDKVEFLGVQPNPYPFLHQADLFVLSSRYEGFPNVLLEAGVCGTYALANDCPGGINEIIQKGINGEISDIQNAGKFAERINELVHQNYDSAKIQESIISRFSREGILEKYNQILSEL
jgi:glycosyltransferase involved in cell wall biosynthesis